MTHGHMLGSTTQAASGGIATPGGGGLLGRLASMYFMGEVPRGAEE